MKQISEKGQILIFITAALVLLCLFVGLAVDGGRAYLLKAELARKVDPAALAAAANIASGFSAAQAAACNSAKMNDLDCSGLTITQEPVSLPGGGSVDGLRVSATAIMPTSFMRVGRLIGCTICDDVTVVASAVAVPGNNFDLVMNLDDTNSMAGANMTNAKNGANALVDAVVPASSSSTLAKVGMAPFRGCYNSTGSNDCKDSGDFPGSGHVVPLTIDNNRLHNGINVLNGAGGSGTNVCEGLSMARQRLFESPGSVSRAEASKFIVILTDAENNYTQTASFGSPPNFRNCNPPGSNAAERNRNLGDITWRLATDIKTGANVGPSGQPSGKTVTIFVILYGDGAGNSVTTLSGGCAALNTANPNDNASYMRTLAQCIASSPGDLYLAPTPQAINDAFFDIIARLPVRLVI